MICNELQADLVEFSKYANFTYEDITAVLVREGITEEINLTTPAVLPKASRSFYNVDL